MRKTLIRIMGAGRSGTTMLDLMLGNDEESFSLGEVRAWFRPFRKHHFKIDCNCGNPNCEIWSKLKDCSESEFYEKAFEHLDVNVLIDSSKNLAWMIDSIGWTKEKGLASVNLLIYKPIISYIYSIWKRGESINAAIYRYKLYHRRFFQSAIPTYIINYDELVKNTDLVLEKICKITDQHFDENRKFFWRKNHHHLFGSGGTRAQSRNGNSSINSVNEFTSEFMDLIPEINKKIAKDKNLLLIIEKLQRNSFNLERVNIVKKEPLFKPLWYYYLKCENKIRSKFPTLRNVLNENFVNHS